MRFLLILALVLGFSVTAQSFPDRYVTAVVPSAPGNGNDVLARGFTDLLSKKIGQSIIIENKPGAGTTIGVERAVRAPADGYTLLINSAAMVTADATTPVTYSIRDDLIPIAFLGDTQMALVARKNLATNYSDFISKAKKNELSAGIVGYGGVTYFSTEKFRIANDAPYLSIPYKGTQEVLVDMIGGRVDYSFLPLQSVAPLVADGKIDLILVVTKDQPELYVRFWAAVFISSKADPAIIGMYYNASREVRKSAEYQKFIKSIDVIPAENMTIEQMQKLIDKDLVEYRKIVQQK